MAIRKYMLSSKRENKMNEEFGAQAQKVGSTTPSQYG
jgi:hypothetical protein